jgi:selenocysteine-specific elongation factor
MSRVRYVIGTAGHIDHGKTELVRALTGTDTDRLPEEKSRGITIDIGFASLDLSPALHLAFIDVPGHERFVKNMLAGIGGVDLVLLVVAADESVMPQTREHFEICSLLGVRRGLVALTKVDLVAGELRELAELEVREFLEGSFLEGSPVVPVSARTGEGVDDLRRALEEAVEGLEPKDSGGAVRLPVDRSFSIRGFGTVVTGTLFSGTLRQGDELVLYPASRPVKVRGIEVHGQSSTEAVAGQRVAVNLQGADTSQVRRGDVLAPAGVLRASRLVDVQLELLPSAPGPLKNLGRVRYHQGTSEVLARVRLLENQALPPGGAAAAQLRLEEDQVALPGDRFILRRYSPPRTIGGGTVLDPLPRKHRGTAVGRLALLERLRSAGPGERLGLLVDRAGCEGITVADLQVRMGLPLERLRVHLSAAQQEGRVTLVGEGSRGLCMSAGALEEFRTEVIRELEEHHRAHPLETGLGKEELRVRVFGATTVESFRHVLALLGREDIVVEGDRVRMASHRLRLSAEEEQARSTIEAAFRDGALNPPDLEGVARASGIPSYRADALYHLLVREGLLVRIAGGLTFHRQALDDLRERLLQFRRQNETISIAAFKELSGTTRKNAIPLLEYLDAAHVTCRRGSERVILPPWEEHSPTQGGRSGRDRN